MRAIADMLDSIEASVLDNEPSYLTVSVSWNYYPKDEDTANATTVLGRVARIYPFKSKKEYQYSSFALTDSTYDGGVTFHFNATIPRSTVCEAREVTKTRETEVPDIAAILKQQGIDVPEGFVIPADAPTITVKQEYKTTEWDCREVPTLLKESEGHG